jgi:hypothetical protein
MAQRSNPALWKPVEQNSLYKAVYLERNRAQRIPSWPGEILSVKGRIHLRRPTRQLTFRLRKGGGPYICSAPVAPFYFALDNSHSKVYQWQTANGEAFIFGRADWEYVLNTFCFGYHVAYKFAELRLARATKIS